MTHVSAGTVRTDLLDFSVAYASRTIVNGSVDVLPVSKERTSKESEMQIADLR